MYIVIVSFNKSPEIVEPYFKAHCAWLHQYINADIFIASGPKKSHLGGAFLVRSIDKQQLNKILSEDSYFKADVADYLIVDMDCKLASTGFENLINS